MSAPSRPPRAVLALVALIVLALGVGAYLVNIPLLWVTLGEVVALAGVALWATRVKRPQPVTSEAPNGTTKL